MGHHVWVRHRLSFAMSLVLVRWQLTVLAETVIAFALSTATRLGFAASALARMASTLPRARWIRLVFCGVRVTLAAIHFAALF